MGLQKSIEEMKGRTFYHFTISRKEGQATPPLKFVRGRKRFFDLPGVGNVVVSHSQIYKFKIFLLNLEDFFLEKREEVKVKT